MRVVLKSLTPRRRELRRSPQMAGAGRADRTATQDVYDAARVSGSTPGEPPAESPVSASEPERVASWPDNSNVHMPFAISTSPFDSYLPGN